MSLVTMVTSYVWSTAGQTDIQGQEDLALYIRYNTIGNAGIIDITTGIAVINTWPTTWPCN